MITDATPIVLTASELEALTGYQQHSRMCRWLQSRGWVFEMPARAGDTPKVDRAYYLARMSGQTQAKPRLGPTLEFMTAGKAS